MKLVKHKAEGLPGILGMGCCRLALDCGLSVLGSSGRSVLTLGEHTEETCNLQQGGFSLANAPSKTNGSSLPAWTTQPKEEGMGVSQE